MKKLILSAAVAAAVAGSAFTYSAIAAQETPVAPGAQQTADRGVELDAKLAGMKATLKLTPDQEKLWPAFETAVRDAEKARIDAMEERHDEMKKGERPSPIVMITQMSDRLAKMSSELKKVAEAATPLYGSFDEGQKAHFGPLLRMIRQNGRGAHPQNGGQMQGPAPKPL